MDGAHGLISSLTVKMEIFGNFMIKRMAGD
jgi:hypothetical protein